MEIRLSIIQLGKWVKFYHGRSLMPGKVIKNGDGLRRISTLAAMAAHLMVRNCAHLRRVALLARRGQPLHGRNKQFRMPGAIIIKR